MRLELYVRRMTEHLVTIVNFSRMTSVQYETVFVRVPDALAPTCAIG
jgi:hypothetical protein